MKFVLNVIAAIVGGVILGYLIAIQKYINVVLNFGATRKIWSPFFKGDTALIITGRKGKLPRSTIKNSYSELLGGIALRDFFAQFNRSFTVLNSKMDTVSIYKLQNVILLGSQNANPITKAISERIAIPFSYDEHGNLTLTSRKKIYSSKPTDGSPLGEDYALIIKSINPYNPEKRIMILAGNHGCATEASVRYMISKTGIAKIAKQLGSSDFLGVIKVQIENNISKHVELVDCWKFEEIPH